MLQEQIKVFLATIMYLAIDAGGVKRIRYADTVSSLSPPFTAHDRIVDLINRLQDYLGSYERDFSKRFCIDFHGHNDFGLGTANALGAYRAGAKAISCSVNGLGGERAGNTPPLEEIVLALEMMENVTSLIDKKQIMQVSKMVEKYSGRDLQLSKPIVGEMVFSHEAGIHVDGLMKDKRTYAYLEPRMLGRTHQFVQGKHSGNQAKFMN